MILTHLSDGNSTADDLIESKHSERFHTNSATKNITARHIVQSDFPNVAELLFLLTRLHFPSQSWATPVPINYVPTPPPYLAPH